MIGSTLRRLLYETWSFLSPVFLVLLSFSAALKIVFFVMPRLFPPEGDDMGYPFLLLVVSLISGLGLSFAVLRFSIHLSGKFGRRAS